MSDAITPTTRDGIRHLVANRWQIPIFVVSCALFGWGLWNLRPAPPVISFDDELKEVVALHKARRYVEASALAEMLYAQEQRTAEERRRLHRVLGDILFDFESNATQRTPVHLERLVEHYRASAGGSGELEGGLHLRVAQALEWLDRPQEAADEYGKGLAKGAGDPVPVRRRILELRRRAGSLSADQLATELDAFLRIALADPSRSSEVVWATGLRVELLLRNDDTAKAAALLDAIEPAVGPETDEAQRNLYLFLRAYVAFRQNRQDESERLLRDLRNRMTVRDEVDAASGWLLGRIALDQSSPATALELFDGVLAAHFRGPYVAAAKLGRAEALVALERHAEALTAYEETLALLPTVGDSLIIGRETILMSLTQRWDELFRAGRWNDSLAYLRLAADLVPAGDRRRQSIYTERLSELLAMIGRREIQEAEKSEDRRAALQESGHRRLVEAGEAYLRLAVLATEREPEAAAAVWKAADAFDRAGERLRTIEVLERFIADRPQSTRVPEALLRLGMSYQALNRPDEAIRCYQRAVTDHPRTPPAIASLVPLAECYMALGLDHAAQAERTLLMVLEESPDRPPLLTPDASAFRDALFRIADLYTLTEQYDRAIIRLEEARKRYPDDARVFRAVFQLAEAYRLSAGKLPAAIADPKNVSRRDDLVNDYRHRLRQARTLYEEVIAAAEAHRSSGGRSDLDTMCVRMSYLYRADCVFDEQAYAGDTAPEGYGEAIRLYNEAAWRFRGDPISLPAYLQMIHAHLRRGDLVRARATLERAQWILRGIPDDTVAWQGAGHSKKTWTDYLTWLAASPSFRTQGT